MTAREVVVISKDSDVTSLARETLQSMGCEVKARQSAGPSLRNLKGTELIFLNLDGETPAAMREIISYHPEALMVVAGSAGEAEKSLSEGAFDCIEKPISRIRLQRALKRALDLMALREEASALRRAKAPRLVVGRNRKMLKAAKQMEKAAEKDTAVLILGQKGVGKETVARNIHAESIGASGPFVVVGADSSDPGVALFGDASGRSVKPGALAAASGGSVFINGVEHLAPEARRKLVSFLKTGRFRPVGGTVSLGAELRVICAAGELDKQSALFKAFGMKIVMPPLGERGDDTLSLAVHFLRDVAAETETAVKSFSSDARQYILEHPWPGNAGELKNAVRKGCLMAAGEDKVGRRHLASGNGSAYCSVKEFLDDKLKEHLAGMSEVRNSALFDTVTSEFEKALIELVLKETGGNQLKASKLLSLNRNTLRAKIKLYSIKNGRTRK